MKDCLEAHREDAGFSDECKTEFEAMMEARASDFRLDSSLAEACATDIEDVCGYERVSSALQHVARRPACQPPQPSSAPPGLGRSAAPATKHGIR